MRVDILAIGSQGDVQPFVALGLGLKGAGHRVRIITLSGFETLVRSRGLDHLSIGESPRAIGTTSEGQSWIRKRTNPLGFLRGFIRVAETMIEEGVAAYWRSSQDVETIISSPMGLLVAGHVAERLDIPLVEAYLSPPTISTHYDWEGRKSLGTVFRGELTGALGAAFRFAIWRSLRPASNAARANVLGLPPLPLLGDPFQAQRRIVLCGYSAAVAPKMPDWSESIHISGYWFLDELPGWRPPDNLVDFVSSGPPPIFIGFGSTPFPEPEATTKLVVDAVARAGQRCVLVAGGSGLGTGRLSDAVFGIDAVPHSWLFGRIAAAVHHGGAGVTGAALRAGLPSVVVPVFADQPFWGSRVFGLGVGPRPIPAKKLTTDSLARAIQATTSKEMRARAAALGVRIQSENGVARALDILHSQLGICVAAPRDSQHAV